MYFDLRADQPFHFRVAANVELLGIGGVAVDALIQNDPAVISPSSPDTISLKLAQMISPYRDQKRLAQ